MKQPIHWKANKEENQQPLESSTRNKANDTLKLILCLLFLIASSGLWIVVGSQFRWLVFLLLVVPGYACGEWLSSKIFSENSGLSISQSGFSILRIIYGVIIAVALLGCIYILGLFLSRLFFTNS